MPNDSAANPPQRAATGQTQLPLSRVRKIIALDPDVNVCSSNAAFVITLATEHFLQHLATEGHNMVKLDRKPRKNLQYRDLASAVSRIDRLEFLEDTIPNTVTFGKIKGDAAKVRKAFTGETVAGLFGNAAANGSAGGAAHGSDASKSGGGSASKSGGSKKGRSSTGAPTAISALMTDMSVDSVGFGETAGAGAKRQQVLPFSILNGDENNSSFMSARGGTADDSVLSSDGVDSGVAAAAALAQAAAASGASPVSARPLSSASGMAVDDADPDAQLAQDMRRVNDDGINGAHTHRGGRSSGRGRYSNGDVQMQNN
ncbi:histone-like transcription factor and archaeal histone [Ophiostoma piceae UAMH 11346]|uniref:Histone-like transcription factor and archaeal histone n=1 Tax=Ophiostoma piceae (strain UAMH 11346) TaxID=1262450 RepID=S3CPK2_OPHP1|nr:histone-like transcription factor and archaeal histone [Ophiostoma piceae UAMH 11346]